MGWFTSLFTSDTSQNVRKGQALTSTHEAFSLPTSSPGFSPHPDAFNPELLHTAEPDSATSPSFTYPPQSGSGSYGYVPTSAGSRSRPASLLPLHHSPTSPSPPYPPLSQTWNRLRSWLTREYPELGDTLNYGILPQDLAQIEMQFGFALPAVVRESYLVVDGQEAESAAGCSEGLFFGLTLLPLEDVLEEWRFWREVDDDPTTGANPRLRDVMQSIPPGWVRKEYSQRGWIPLVADKAGNYVGIDLNPGEGGSVGQVIVFGREFDTKVVLWRGEGPTGWAKWLASFVDELESGEGYEIGTGNDTSEGSEDGVGYESYFYDGSGRGQGDGGGESGPGGLRLAGEYRGWNVLEAWADRSVRRWYESGVAPEPALTQPEEEQIKKTEKHGLGVLDFAAASRNLGAEVPIPVLADVSSSSDGPIATSAPALGNVTNTAPRHSLPTISVTKPPAPLPVELPTPHDIAALPSPPDSAHSSDDGDLEAGHGTGMREILHEQEQVLTRKPIKSPVGNADASGSKTANLVPITSAPTQSEYPVESIPPPPSGATMSDISDLLADSAPAIEATPITPSSPSSSKSPDMAAVPIPDLVGEIPVEQEDTSVAEETEATTDPDVTIRLVGGGGTAGTADVTSTPDGDALVDGEPDPDVVEAAPATSVSNAVDPAAKKGAKHEKNKKSISSGLKKLGQLGAGKRKKNSSSSSIKEAI